MDWVKRNLYFLIGAGLSLLCMAAAGYYFYSKWSLNKEIREKLEAEYTTLANLNRENPHPGDRKTDNVKAAKEQQEQLKAFIAKARDHFQPIPPIPDVGQVQFASQQPVPQPTPDQPADPNQPAPDPSVAQPRPAAGARQVTSQEFTSALRRTLDQLQKTATNNSVIVPNNYSFSFEALKPRVTFATGSLEPLSFQLGEVKHLCDLLFAAKINSLDSIRRERVSPDDTTSLTDYLDKKSVTNQLAVLRPYELTFRCFSSELAGVLNAIGTSPHALIVKTINVEPITATPSYDPNNPYGTPIYNPMAVPGYTPPPPTGAIPAAETDAATQAAVMARRYGIGSGSGLGGVPYRGGAEGGGAGAGGIPYRGLTPGGGVEPGVPGYTPPPPTYGAAQPGYRPASPRGGLPTVLDEKQVRVTIGLDIVKLLPSK